MKTIISVSVDAETVKIIQDLMRTKTFRNKSHVVEEAVRRMGE